MRGTSTWNSVKPILKVLQEYFSAHIHTAHIIKPDNFWQKQRTSLGSQKYKFETNLIGMDALLKVLDPTQLTPDLDGALMYDHSVWIELRCALEDFLWQSSDLLGKLDEMREDLNANDFADDVTSAKQAVDAHMEMRRRILKIPVENIDNVGQRLLHRLSTAESTTDSGYSGRDSVSSSMAYSPDLQVSSCFYFSCLFTFCSIPRVPVSFLTDLVNLRPTTIQSRNGLNTSWRCFCFHFCHFLF